MNAAECLRDGRLDDAFEVLKTEVQKEPAAPKHRIFLFQLLAVRGEWDRALKHLNIVGDLSADALPMVQTYRELLRCEALRKKVFAGETTPLAFGQPQQWLALMVEALRLTAAGKIAEAEALRAQALDQARPTAGTIDGKPFAWLADADSRLGPVLEAVISGRYYWVPLQNVKCLTIEAPTDLRDLVWSPAEITWVNGGQTVAFVPTRYPGSEHDPDSAIRMARKTTWEQLGEQTFIGKGQRVFATDSDDVDLLSVRKIEFESAATPAVLNG